MDMKVYAREKLLNEVLPAMKELQSTGNPDASALVDMLYIDAWLCGSELSVEKPLSEASKLYECLTERIGKETLRSETLVFAIRALTAYDRIAPKEETLRLAESLFAELKKRNADELLILDALVSLCIANGSEKDYAELKNLVNELSGKEMMQAGVATLHTARLLNDACDILKDSALTEKVHRCTSVLMAAVLKNGYESIAPRATIVGGFLNAYRKNPGRIDYLEAAEQVLKSEDEPDFLRTGLLCIEVLAKDWIHPKYYELLAEQKKLLARKNAPTNEYNGIYTKYRYPVVTAQMVPLTWRYDLSATRNPNFMERLGVNATLNSGAIKHNGKYYLVVRTEGMDRKSFFSVCESDNGIDGFRFIGKPLLFEDTCPEETNVYDMRLTKHEDGYIYGVFCSESKDTSVKDLSAAVAAAGIVRTKDLINWERLPNLTTLRSPQQRNVVLHPEFVNGCYAFYTRPMDDFIDTGSGGGIGFGLCKDIMNPVIDEEVITSSRKYHTITEVKNGCGAVPIKSKRGWLHIAHGVRNTAAGLRYVLYCFATDLNDPSKVIAEPSGMYLGPHGIERVGDVSNVVFTNGAILDDDGQIFIYYASSDTRMHVAKTTLARLEDYIFNTPEDPLRSVLCVQQRNALIDANEALIDKQ